MGGVAVPHKEADEGNRFLGYIIDMLGDGGDQVARLEQSIDEIGASIKRTRASKGIVAYLVEAVLIPRVMYPLAVATLSPDQIRRLESRALRWILPKLGLSPSFSRNLVGTGSELGGLGWTRWTVRVAILKSQLAMDLSEHPEAGVRGTWASMRTRGLLSDRLGSQMCMGMDEAGEDQLKERENTWLASLQTHLAELHVKWADGWAPPRPRKGDVLVSAIIYQGVCDGRIGAEEGVELVKWASAVADILWLSDLCSSAGHAWWRWPDKVGWQPQVDKIRALVEGGRYEPLGECIQRESGEMQ